MATLSLGLLLLGALLDGTGVAKSDNPIIQTIYTADPAPIVYDGRLYVFVDHDENGATTYVMKNWHLFSTVDMGNWQDHGTVMSLATFAWCNANAWAGQVIERNNKFYYYAPVRSNDGSMAIGVGVSNTITGPYTDALGHALVENGGFDPTVWIDDNGQAYLYWANPGLWYVTLNEDMISYSGSVQTVQLTTAGFGVRPGGNSQRPTTFEEGPWIYKRDANGLYYLVYAADCCSEDIRYSTAPTITGPWTYKGVVMPTQGGSFTNHPGVIDYQGHSYFFYHNGALPGGGGYDRSVCVEEFTYNADGTIPSLTMTTAGPAQIASLNPYVRQEAETNAWSWGMSTEVCSEGGMDVTDISNGDYIKVKGVDFGSGAASFAARVASAGSGGKLELRLDSSTGMLVGTCVVSNTGGAQMWATVTCPVSGATGKQDLYFHFTGGSGNLFSFDYWQFFNGSSSSSSSSSAAPPSTSASSAAPSSTSLSSAPCATLYGQCGGSGWTGPFCCAQGTCRFSNTWYSQCLN
ncbi:carbohydrate-binding module family 1 protein [Oidiodendron maius Zn]|uniref:Carbohydrate-binding module family 1 protein n=1 Tax=Oidiodendron maius (strain Zn) TaxID=913774 RepID=A0A0C3H3N1_OIDMZ|nr:carbohydrate-binding module family 1 protein [Oidiodendron maius Zn]